MRSTLLLRAVVLVASLVLLRSVVHRERTARRAVGQRNVNLVAKAGLKAADTANRP